MEATFEDHLYEGITPANLTKGRYLSCRFIGCNLVEADLTNYSFVDCTFSDCNLSMSKIEMAAFKSVSFDHCKMLGLRFDLIHPFLFKIEIRHSILDLSNFSGVDLSKTTFDQCQLREVDFTDANLTSGSFDDCDLHLSIFVNTHLESCDFQTARNFMIDPTRNMMKKAVFDRLNIEGLVRHLPIVIK